MRLAVAQDRDAVGDPGELLHAVGDVDDAHALRLESRHQLKQAMGLPVGQRGRRLVEDEHRDLAAQRLGDLDHLLLRPRQARNRRVVIDVETEVGEHVARTLPDGGAVQQAMARRLVAQDQVLRHRQCRNQRKLLEHRADAAQPCLLHARQLHTFAADADLAAGGRVGARQQRDQRRLAGAVLPEQHVHLARRSSKSTASRASTPG